MIDECGRCEPVSGICTRVPCNVIHKPNTSGKIIILPYISIILNRRICNHSTCWFN